MKRMIISIAAPVVAACSAFAQINVGAAYSGTGMNLSEGDNTWYNGFNVSVGYNLPLGLGFEFSPSVEYNYLTRSADVSAGVPGIMDMKSHRMQGYSFLPALQQVSDCMRTT